jgi:adenylate cyclase
MGKEIERKYLVQSDAWRDRVQSTEHYQQGYLSTEEERSVRVRVGKRKAFFTIKGKATGQTRAEFEYPLPLKDANQLLEHLCVKPLITKTRHTVQANGLTWEIDEFSGENSPLILAELETKSDQAPKQKPPWVGEEVTHDPRYLNINLVAHPYSMWEKDILQSSHFI